MAFWHQPKQFYQIEAKASKNDLLDSLFLKIKLAKETKGFSLSPQYPDYKLMSITNNVVEITDASFGRFTQSTAGSMEMTFEGDDAQTIITARFFRNQEVYPAMIIGGLAIVVGILFFSNLAAGLSTAMKALVSIIMMALLFGLFKLAIKVANQALKNYMVVVLRDLGITGEINTITEVC